MGKQTDVTVPDIGDFTDVPVIEVLVADGDTVEADQALIVLESDKSTMEVPAPAAGTVRGLKVKVGDKLSQGSTICGLEAADGGDGEADNGSQSESRADTEPEPEPEAQSDAGSQGKEAPRAAAGSKPAKSAGPPSSQSVTVPDLGDFADVPVIELLVAEGDTVAADQALLVLESDKSTMEVPSPVAGKVTKLAVKVGDKVSKGDELLTLEGEGGAGSEAAQADPAAKPDTPAQGEAAEPSGKAQAKQAEVPPAPEDAPKPSANAHAGPATRKFARELGVDLSKVQGSGAKGRIVIEDVQRHVKARMTGPAPTPGGATGGATGGGIPAIPAQDFSKFGEVETQPLSRIRKLSAAHLHRAWLNVPHVTQHDEADITDLEAFRKSAGKEGEVKLTLLPFVMKAVAVTLRQYPEFNASLAPDGENLILKRYCHVGFAADTPNGLVVPVVRDVWAKTLTELAAECGELAKKARDGKLKPDEMRGGCFSISSLGGIGGGHFTPIVNAPEVGILGVSRGVMKPVWDGKAFQPRLMLPLSLSYDHRVIDGAYAARFIVTLVSLLSDIRRLSL